MFELDSAALADLLGASSPLAPFLAKFEHRPEQQDMAREVSETFNEGGLSLIEAGTGVGKSLAYLLPALIWASNTKEKIVISTHTIALQEQLLTKDLPDLIDALELDIDIELVKGMHHYLCLSRLHTLAESHPAFSTLGAQLQAIAANGNCSNEHLRELPQIRCEGEHCNGGRCDFYNACHFFKARRRADKAQILIVNHHILLLDYLRRLEDPANAILPNYTKLIIDEAHHLEKTATNIFAKRLSIHELTRMLSDLSQKESAPSLTSKIDECIGELGFFASVLHDKVSFEAYTPPENTQKVLDLLLAIEVELVHLCEKTKEPLKTELLGFAKKCAAAAALFQELLFNEIPQGSVRWVEPTRHTVPSFCEASITSKENLRAFLSGPTSTVLCSATLSNSDSFDYIREQIGFEESETLIESRHLSPFDYPSQAACLIPTDLPLPDNPSFVEKSLPLILSLIKQCKGGVFILCTSHRSLNDFYDMLSEHLKGYRLLRQGEAGRSQLLERFRSEKKPVLVGTSSFWEGVDVAGKMRGVVIVKLPFQVPSEPLTLARYKLLESAGKSPFIHHSLPEAVLRFTQGFGRLIRTKTDRGICLCLDVRLYQKGYGKKFLKGMPAPIQFGSSEEIKRMITDFWSVTESNR